jgi:hypothetical protein
VTVVVTAGRPEERWWDDIAGGVIPWCCVICRDMTQLTIQSKIGKILVNYMFCTFKVITDKNVVKN